MNIAQLLGIGDARIKAQGHAVEGCVCAVQPLYWLRVNTSPVRIGTRTGNRFPHIITVQYSVNGTAHEARRMLGWTQQPPATGRRVRVYYDSARPGRCAIEL